MRWSRRGRWQQPCSRTAIGGFGRQKKIAVLAWLLRRGSNQLESAPNMTFVRCKLIDVCAEGAVLDGRGREGKGRINAAAYTTGNAFVSATGQLGGMCNNINRGTAWSSRARREDWMVLCFGWCVAGRALKPGVWLLSTRASGPTVPSSTCRRQPSPAESLAAVPRLLVAQGRDSNCQERQSSELARGRERDEMREREVWTKSRRETHKYSKRPDPLV